MSYKVPVREQCVKLLRVKPEVQWRPQEFGDARNVKSFLGKAVSREQSQPRERQYEFKPAR